jgi:glycosyltransferase involved in cell wall biosynthesis
MLNNRKIKVMHVLPSLNQGGVERCVVEISNAMLDLGYDVTVLSSGGKMESFLKDGIIIKKMNLKTKNPIKLIINAKAIKRFAEENQIDIVHAHSRAPAWSCYIAKIGAKFKFVTTFHGVYGVSNVIKRFYNSVMINSDAVIAVSSFVKNHIIHKYKTDIQKINVIPNGIPFKYYSRDSISKERKLLIYKKLQIKDNISIITFPARLTHSKGHMILIKALKAIKRKDYVCFFVGKAKQRSNFKKILQTCIDKSGVSDNVVFVDNIDDMPAMYSISDVILSISVKPESFGRTIIEAGMMGKIVISTNIGGPSDNIINGETGFFIPPNDYVALAKTLIDVMDMKNVDRDRISENAIRFTRDNFDISKSVDLHHKLYIKLIS